MKNRLRVVVLVSSDISDIYFANQLIKRLHVVGVFIENQFIKDVTLSGRLVKVFKYFTRPETFIKKIKDEIYGRYYGKKARRIALEGFGADGIKIENNKGYELIYTNGENLNEVYYADRIRELNPDVIAVCGTSVLKKPVLSIPVKGVLNLHGGLSQRYRGVWTTLWAIYNEEPEYVGATVHYVNEGVDTGDIIYQGRPEISEDDNHETLYVKVVELGTSLMIKAVNDIERNNIKSHRLKEKGELYLNKMVTPEIIRETWGKVNSGVIRDYLKRKLSNGDNVKIIR